MKRISLLAVVLVCCLELAGCAHPVSMVPNLAAIPASSGATVANKKVAYYISDASRALEVTTPGGGGDKVRYFPYRDLEAGLYKTLATVFREVTKVSKPDDLEGMRQGGISVLVQPEISTMSFSDSIVTWPPTMFTVNLTCQFKDAQGQVIDTISVSGTGMASFDQFKSNVSLSSARASDDALQKLAQALRQSTALTH
jgi:hypothetical protein